jgi:hypothetical protein
MQGDNRAEISDKGDARQQQRIARLEVALRRFESQFSIQTPPEPGKEKTKQNG